MLIFNDSKILDQHVRDGKISVAFDSSIQH